MNPALDLGIELDHRKTWSTVLDPTVKMAKGAKDERSWEDRIGSFSDAIGDVHIEFDRTGLEAEASPEEVAADALLLALRASGMTALLAMKVIRYIASQRQATEAVHSSNVVAMDSLMRSEAKEGLGEIFVILLEKPKPRFSLGCLMLALGMDHPSLRSQRHWAAAQLMTPEHASNEVTKWQELLKLPATSAQKSESAKDSYRLRNQPRKAA